MRGTDVRRRNEIDEGDGKEEGLKIEEGGRIRVRGGTCERRDLRERKEERKDC